MVLMDLRLQFNDVSLFVFEFIEEGKYQLIDTVLEL